MNVLYEAITSLHRQVDERIADDATTPCLLSFDRARAVLDALLAQPEQEPVAWRYRGNLHEFDPSDWAEGPVTPLYTTPPRREWVGLTEEDFSSINQSCLTKLQAATSAESILKEKNNAK